MDFNILNICILNICIFIFSWGWGKNVKKKLASSQNVFFYYCYAAKHRNSRKSHYNNNISKVTFILWIFTFLRENGV